MVSWGDPGVFVEVVHHVDPGIKDESQIYQELDVDLKAHQAFDDCFAKSLYLTL